MEERWEPGEFTATQVKPKKKPREPMSQRTKEYLSLFTMYAFNIAMIYATFNLGGYLMNLPHTGWAFLGVMFNAITFVLSVIGLALSAVVHFGDASAHRHLVTIWRGIVSTISYNPRGY